MDARPPLAIVAIPDSASRFRPCLGGLQRAVPEAAIVLVGGPSAADLADELGCEHADPAALAGLVQRAVGEARHLIVATAPVLVPPDFATGALDHLAEQPRVASISFLSNNAGFLSVPVRNAPAYHLLASHDERSVTDALRRDARGGRFLSVPAPAGGVNVISRHAVSACGGLRGDLPLSVNGLVTELALRAQRRGFVCAVDSWTFVLSPLDVGATDADPLDDADERPVLVTEHPFVEAALEWARTSDRSPSGLVVARAAARLRGLRVCVDGRCLGDQQMGTQVQTLALAEALAANPDVQTVTIATNGPVPAYARDVFAHPRVHHQVIANDDFSVLPESDVIHRPYQPDTALPLAMWRRRASRVLVTLQDLIAYQVGAYAPTGAGWLRYREVLRRGSEGADGVIVISEDTAKQVEFEALNIERDRLFVVPNGTDHLTGHEPDATPVGLLGQDFGASRFLVVLGANYAHKNRDLAIAAWNLVRADHVDVALVLVGAAAPHGSSRIAEAAATPRPASGLYVLPDVTSAERNWLLRHAEAVVYPTSAEGFGLVPFEAARFGTPTVHVSFGPLAEVNPQAGGATATWDARAFATSIAELLDDPVERGRRVSATVAAGLEYTWARTAARLVSAYRDILSRPPLDVGRSSGDSTAPT